MTDEEIHKVCRMYIDLLMKAGNYTWAEGKKMTGKHFKAELFKLAKKKGISVHGKMKGT